MQPTAICGGPQMMKFDLVAVAAAALFASGPMTAVMAHDTAIGLYEFGNASGYDPVGGVIADHDGTVFGTTAIGGSGPCYGGMGCGTVYALSPQGGKWKLEVIYNFQDGEDGAAPAAQLTLGPNGSLFGYDAYGANGVVFQLSPPATKGAAWSFQILYDFGNGAKGNLRYSTSPVIWYGKALYGIAYGGSDACGQAGCGSVFRLTPPKSGNGSWTEKTLIKFDGAAGNGEPTWIAGPNTSGSLYVSTGLNDGAVAQISPPHGKGQWAETVLTTFNGGNDGSVPTNLVWTAKGTLYGTAYATKAGLAFELANNGNGWTRTNIARIAHGGFGPNSLSAGPDGTLIGAIFGYVDIYTGAVFQLAPPENGGNWTYAQLCNFKNGPDYFPINVVTERGGALFGVLNGGDMSNGGLFELH
jgi:hypothetical protein